MKDRLSKKEPRGLEWLAHQECEDMFILSKWNHTKTYGHPIEREFGTDHGICCWYTPQVDLTEVEAHRMDNNFNEPDWGYWFAKLPKEKFSFSQMCVDIFFSKGSLSGLGNGFQMVLDIETFDYELTNEGSEGIKVGLVHHLDMPIMGLKSINLSPGTDNNIEIKPTLISTSKNAVIR